MISLAFRSYYCHRGAETLRPLFPRDKTMKVTIFLLSLLLILPAYFSGQQPAPALKGVPQFTADPKWPMLPDGFTWGQVIGIFAVGA